MANRWVAAHRRPLKATRRFGQFAAPPLAADNPILSLLDLSPAPIWVQDDETGRFLAVNDAALRRYGYDRERFLAMSLDELLAGRAAGPGFELPVDGEPRRAHLRRADGSLVEIELTAKPAEYQARPAALVAAAEIGGQARLGQAPAESEQRYLQLLDAASDWFWEADSRGFLTYLSPKYGMLYGTSTTALLGKRLHECPGVKIGPEMAETARAAIKARASSYDHVYSIEPPDGGKERWVHSTSIPVFDDKGRLSGFRGASRDISVQVEAERALRDSEQRFRRLFEINSDYYWEVDPQHLLTFVSPVEVHDAIYGVPFSQLIGKRQTEHLGVSFEPEPGMRVLSAIRKRKPFRDAVFSVKHPDGAVKWVSMSGAPKLDEAGDYVGYHGTGVEITARKEAEAVAQLAQRRLHDAVAHVTQPFVVYDADDCTTAFNQAFANLFRTATRHTPIRESLSIAELAEWQVRMNFYAGGPDDPPVDAETLLAHHHTEDEHTYHLSDGSWMLVIHRRLPGGGRVGLWTDVTAIKRSEEERRRLEQQLYHSQRLEALGTLAGGVAHELNNMLVPVIALTKRVAGKLPEGSRERRNLDTVVGAAQSSRDLVSKILAFSRQQGTQAREPVDVGGVLHEALNLMRATLPAGISVEEAITPSPPVNADPDQLQQVIINLVTNAAHAIGEAVGTIGVRLAPMTGSTELCLSISDTGCGMDEATKARIFDPFFTTKAVGQGTGLGLAIVHGIVKDHGGRIDVESTPGQGARFDIILPVPADEGA